MPVVHIPAHWRSLADGRDRIQVTGTTLGDVVARLAEAAPALGRVLLDDGALRGEVAIAVNSVVTENDPLELVPADAEVFLIPAIGGGAR